MTFNVTNAAYLPGAILFMTITFKEGTTADNIPLTRMNVVGYDPLLQPTETLAQIQARYANNLPYFERFSPPGQADVSFEDANHPSVYFTGVFGGPGKKHAPKSKSWSEAVTGKIANGVTLTYWNQAVSPSVTNRGVFTAAAGEAFSSSSRSNIMKVFPGASVQLGCEQILRFLGAKTITLEYYATHSLEVAAFKPPAKSKL